MAKTGGGAFVTTTGGALVATAGAALVLAIGGALVSAAQSVEAATPSPSKAAQGHANL